MLAQKKKKKVAKTVPTSDLLTCMYLHTVNLYIKKGEETGNFDNSDGKDPHQRSILRKFTTTTKNL